MQGEKVTKEVSDEGYEEIAGRVSRFWREGSAEISNKGRNLTR